MNVKLLTNRLCINASLLLDLSNRVFSHCEQINTSVSTEAVLIVIHSLAVCCPEEEEEKICCCSVQVRSLSSCYTFSSFRFIVLFTFFTWVSANWTEALKAALQVLPHHSAHSLFYYNVENRASALSTEPFLLWSITENNLRCSPSLSSSVHMHTCKPEVVCPWLPTLSVENITKISVTVHCLLLYAVIVMQCTNPFRLNSPIRIKFPK